MNNKVASVKTCVLLDDIDCIKDALQFDGIDAFDRMASLSAPGPWRDLFLDLRRMDAQTQREIESHQRGNLIQLLSETVPAICGLLNRKAEKIRQYTSFIAVNPM